MSSGAGNPSRRRPCCWRMMGRNVLLLTNGANCLAGGCRGHNLRDALATFTQNPRPMTADRVAEPHGAPQHDINRAELRQYVGAYFKVSGWYTTVAIILQISAVALATLPQVRGVLDPYTHWFVLGLALTAPL